MCCCSRSRCRTAPPTSMPLWLRQPAPAAPLRCSPTRLLRAPPLRPPALALPSGVWTSRQAWCEATASQVGPCRAWQGAWAGPMHGRYLQAERGTPSPAANPVFVTCSAYITAVCAPLLWCHPSRQGHCGGALGSRAGAACACRRRRPAAAHPGRRSPHPGRGRRLPRPRAGQRGAEVQVPQPQHAAGGGGGAARRAQRARRGRRQRRRWPAPHGHSAGCGQRAGAVHPGA